METLIALFQNSRNFHSAGASPVGSPVLPEALAIAHVARGRFRHLGGSDTLLLGGLAGDGHLALLDARARPTRDGDLDAEGIFETNRQNIYQTCCNISCRPCTALTWFNTISRPHKIITSRNTSQTGNEFVCVLLHLCVLVFANSGLRVRVKS